MKKILLTSLRRRSARMFIPAGIVLCLLASGVVQTATTQEGTGSGTGAHSQTETPTTPATPPVTEPAHAPYLIGSGDVLDIRVFNRPQLSRDAVRVDGRGMIRMPLIEEEIQAACRTEAELAQQIANHFRKYQRNPYVDVFVKDYQSQPVAVIGAVDKPGRFQLQRRIRLLELLSFAGGAAERAGGRIQIVRASAALVCEQSAPANPDEGDMENLLSYNLNDVLKGTDNPYVRPGDVISIPEAEQVFVVGNVLRPTTIPLKEPVTVSRAIAMAGGALPDTKSDKVRIIRQVAGGTKTELFVDLKAIDKRRAEDVQLLAGDIVDVPTSSGKRILRSLVGVIAPTVAQLPVRVVN